MGSIGNRFGPSQTGCTVGACEGTEKIMWSGEKKITSHGALDFFLSVSSRDTSLFTFFKALNGAL